MFDSLNDALSLRERYTDVCFQATVVDNADPENLDRIKVDIPELYDNDSGETPWVGPFKLSPFGIGDGYGVFGAPAIGSTVIVKLQGGNPQYPVYIGSLQLAALAGFVSGTNWGFKDPAGNTLNVNLVAKTFSFTSADGVVVQNDGAGSLSVNAPASVNVTSGSDMNLNCGASLTITSPTVQTSNSLSVGSGASGILVDVNGKVATFQNGICVSIV